MHLRKHPGKWKGSVNKSVPEGFDIGTPETKRTKQAQRERRRAEQKRWYDKLSIKERRARWQAQTERNKARRLGLPLPPTWAEMRRGKKGPGGRKPVQEEIRQVPGRGHVDFCPYCGGNIQVVEVAIGIMTPQS
jgi:hypothetical protein